MATKPAASATAKPATKPAVTGDKPVAQKRATEKTATKKEVKTTDVNSIQANTAVITRNKVGSVVTPATERKENMPNVRVLLGSRSSDATVTLMVKLAQSVLIVVHLLAFAAARLL